MMEGRGLDGFEDGREGGWKERCVEGRSGIAMCKLWVICSLQREFLDLFFDVTVFKELNKNHGSS